MVFAAIKFIFHPASPPWESKMASGLGGSRLSVAIPDSLVTDTPHLREKTAKLGTVARACAIFGVHEIILYQEDAQRERLEDGNLCTELLRFLETPQYLRKRLFKLSPSLKFAGILPPLQIPSHDVPRSIRECKKGDVREGVVVAKRGESLEVDAGLERTIECRGQDPVGTRITVRMTSAEEIPVGEIENASKISIYWGYRVRQAKFSLGTLLEKERYDLRIGTSRYGTNVLDVWSQVVTSMRNGGSVLVAFGSPKLGLTEILSQDGVTPRTEEAMIISLAILNSMK
jgi:predicted SPOUT superfamily RNA methylase MTH1